MFTSQARATFSQKELPIAGIDAVDRLAKSFGFTAADLLRESAGG